MNVVFFVIGAVVLLLILMGGWGDPPGNGRHRK